MSQKKAKILIVDDEPYNVDYLEQELEDLGYDSVAAYDGGQALAMAASEAPDMILLDIMMPVMDGFQVLAKLKADKNCRDIPVVVISAMTDLDSMVKGVTLGADDYLPKPFNDVMLKARLQAGVEKKRLRDMELAYLRQVEQLTDAATALETGSYDPALLDEVSARSDALGNLARVFGRMAQEVYAREQRLRQEVQSLRVELDRSRQEKKGSEIPESRYVSDPRPQPGVVRRIIDD